MDYMDNFDAQEISPSAKIRMDLIPLALLSVRSVVRTFVDMLPEQLQNKAF